MSADSQPKTSPRDPRSSREGGKEHVNEAEDRARRDPSPAREAGDSNERPSGGRGAAPDADERTNLGDVPTPDDAPQRR